MTLQLWNSKVELGGEELALNMTVYFWSQKVNIETVTNGTERTVM